MNKARRKRIEALQETLSAVIEELEAIAEEEDESRENIPESLQNSERYEISEMCSSNMSEAIDCISSASDYLEEIVES